MTNQQITSAYIALSRMGNMQLPLHTTYKLFMLRQSFKTQFDFVAEQERLIVERHGGVQTAQGDYQFTDKETTAAVFADMQELHAMEVDIKFEPVEVSIDLAVSGNLSMNDMQALEGIVVFK